MGNSDRRLDRYFMVVHVSDFVWCHGTTCHKGRTQDRIRGSKGSKVLRTRKIKLNAWNRDHWHKYFCSQGCLHDFIRDHVQRIIALDPRTEPLETPINDPTKNEYGHTIIKQQGVDTIAE